MHGGTAVKITVLAGGVGAARFLAGLVRCVDSTEVTAICNVGDDLQWHGLHVSPDIDTVLYTLSGREGAEGWGLRDDGTATLDALRALGGETWFRIGDRDLATHLRRTGILRSGGSLSEATAALARGLVVRATVLPVTDDPHPTVVITGEGELPFQEYFVRRRASDEVRGFRFPGAAAAAPAPGVLEALGGAGVVVIAPSNPFVSIGPLLAVPGVRDALAATHARRVAVSPIVGGEAIKGPAAAMLRSLGHEVSALGVARLYHGLIDTFVLDTVDAPLAPAIAALGMRAVALDTMMRGDEGRERVARSVLGAVSA
ncbi:MAG: 2-phospho-L-lactate transferase [Dehalococcoidia bacterium]|nr:2-phospho-L-lactate transferase [Dehalococcoidia bacterium]